MKTSIIFLLTFLTFSGFAATNPKKVYELTQEDKAVIVDVREKDEIESGMIEGAIWLPLSKIKKDKEWKNEFLKTTEGKEIFLHCRTGKRSEKAKNILKKENIEAHNLGGYQTLKDILPVKKPGKK